MEEVTPTYDTLLPRVRDLYEHYPTGGHLHIVLDDGNISDSWVYECMVSALKEGNFVQAGLAADLLQASRRCRERLYHADKSKPVTIKSKSVTIGSIEFKPVTIDCLLIEESMHEAIRKTFDAATTATSIWAKRGAMEPKHVFYTSKDTA